MYSVYTLQHNFTYMLVPSSCSLGENFAFVMSGKTFKAYNSITQNKSNFFYEKNDRKFLIYSSDISDRNIKSYFSYKDSALN